MLSTYKVNLQRQSGCLLSVFPVTSFVLGYPSDILQICSTLFPSHIITGFLQVHLPFLDSDKLISLCWLRSVTPPSFSDLEMRNKVSSFQLMDTVGREAQELLATILLLNVGKEKNTHIHWVPVRDRS